MKDNKIVVGLDVVDFKMMMDARFDVQDKELIHMFLKLVFGKERWSLFKNVQNFIKEIRIPTYICKDKLDRNGYNDTVETIVLESISEGENVVKLPYDQERYISEEYIQGFINMLKTKNDTREVSELMYLIDKFIVELDILFFSSIHKEVGTISKYEVINTYEDENMTLYDLREIHED